MTTEETAKTLTIIVGVGFAFIAIAWLAMLAMLMNTLTYF